ncbi:uncharacterized protein LOC119097548 [Pollicipes pollicipes]|uniref:uncharacterized protein LOC119097548 n=1 Tax=Pollicipes pollicipes TaxID=41117 RepID=UPI0018856548|nr:uncharacterized protein LOC119097548 [Pollicipes pollicipes]
MLAAGEELRRMESMTANIEGADGRTGDDSTCDLTDLSEATTENYNSADDDESKDFPAANGPVGAPAQYLHQLHLAMTSMPAELELRQSAVGRGQGVWTRLRVEAGRRFGPFLGNWTVQPVNDQYAWEVSWLERTWDALGPGADGRTGDDSTCDLTDLSEATTENYNSADDDESKDFPAANGPCHHTESPRLKITR